ncbi:hypothetical protein WKK05_22505 [Nostoc sp. UHCC 0302]|uniref:hypothetical protein n=1 Tax=Nostoc sp. UHCC 0302 TaxID=3134896 RepID=UPI00311CC209
MINNKNLEPANQKLFLIEGPLEELEKIANLFESGELNKLLGNEVIDVSVVSEVEINTESQSEITVPLTDEQRDLVMTSKISLSFAERDNYEFEKYELDNLEINHLVPQSLDNQWVPCSLLYEMSRENLSFDDIQSRVKQDKRMEFRRALINSRQLVVNRAAIYNETTVSECFEQPGESQEAFKALLTNGTIVPFLFREESPLEPPAFTTSAFEAWKEVCKDVRMKCLRLSWDEDNQSLIRQRLSLPFHEFGTTASIKDIEQYLRDLNLPEDAREPFQKRLRQVRNKCIEIEDEGKLVTREQLYEAFVTAEGTKPVEKKYDFRKPFAAEIKQLIDLKYNVNLPDALDGIALTPFDSLPRSTLQELKSFQRGAKDNEKDADTWLKLLKNSAFERLQQGLYLQSLLQDGYLDSLASLSLQEVLEVRSKQEWQVYMQNVDALLQNPENFEEMAEAVYQSYINLNGGITNLVKFKRMQERVEIWTPAIEYILEISGAQLIVKWSEQGTTYALNGKISPLVAKSSRVPYVEKFRIAGSQANQADLNMTIELKKGYTRFPGEQWEALQRKIPEIPGFQRELILVGNDATLNRSGEAV